MSSARPTDVTERLSVCVFPTGIAFADRAREHGGDYLRLAFLFFSTLTLEWARAEMPLEMREAIVTQAAQVQARRGEHYQVSTCGQTVLLGDTR